MVGTVRTMSAITKRFATGEESGKERRKRSRRFAPYVAGVAVWAGLLASAALWGRAMLGEGSLHLGRLPPFIGGPRLLPAVRWLLPIGVGGVLVAGLPTLSRRLRWRPLLLTCWLGAGAWATSLAGAAGWVGLVGPVTSMREYAPTLSALDSGVLSFLRHFVDQLSTYPVHTRGHPPGPVLVLYLLQQIGLPVIEAEAGLVIVVGSSAVAAVAVTVRVLAGQQPARRALPFLVLAPMALWVATSMDAFFLGISSWGVAVLAFATEARGLRASVLALGAGLLLGSALYLTYGMVPYGALVVAVVAARRRWRLLLSATAGVVVVAAAFTAAGFWWFAGLMATHHEWASGIGAERPYSYFLLANLAVLAFMIGPAAAAGIGGLRDRRVWWLVGAALLTLLASDVGGFERGEVERIWLPFAIWLLPATASVPGRRYGWLACHVTLAVTFQGLIHSPW